MCNSCPARSHPFFCVSCTIYGPFPNFVPVIDTPTPDEKKLSSSYYELYPHGVYADGGTAELKGITTIDGGLSGSIDGGVVFDRKNIRYAMRDGWTYCRNIEQHAARTSTAWTAEGLVFLGAGLAGSVAGTKMITEGNVTGTDFAVLGGSLVSIGIGVFGLQRSASAAKASSAASLGMAANDSEAAFALCAVARSQWVSDRQDANAAAQLAMIKYADKYFGATDLADAGASTAGAKKTCDGGDCSQSSACDGGDCSPTKKCDGGNCS